MTEPQGDIDFFISYRGPQAPWALWVNWVVRSNGFSTVLMDEFQTGNDWLAKMEEACERARRLIPLVSESYWESQKCLAEFRTYWQRDSDNLAARFLLPLAIGNFEPPPLYRRLLRTPLHTLTRDEAYAAIVKVLKDISPCEPVAAFTGSEPPFPNASTVGPVPVLAPIAWPPRCPTFVPDMANRHGEFTFFADTLCGTSTQRATLIQGLRMNRL